MYDLIIVGAGPVGLYLAGLLKKYKILILEEHEKIGSPVHCSGLISSNLKKFVKMNKTFIENKVNSAVIHCKKSKVELKPREEVYVINREKFDSCLANVKSNIFLGTKAEEIEIKKENVMVKTNKGIFKSKLLIGCDGANSIVAKKINSRPKEILLGLIGIVEEENYSDFVEIFIDKEKIFDGFFWKIPRGETTEYGCFGKKVNFKLLEEFFKIKDYKKRAGLIPIGPGKTYFHRTLLIGDSAGFSKPWSGGGIIYGFTAAKIAAKTISMTFEKNKFDEKFLRNYEKEWKKILWKNIKLGLLCREIYKKMNNTQINFFLKILQKMKFVNKLDMDFLFT